jgi:hypothetical protein
MSMINSLFHGRGFNGEFGFCSDGDCSPIVACTANCGSDFHDGAHMKRSTKIAGFFAALAAIAAAAAAPSAMADVTPTTLCPQVSTNPTKHPTGNAGRSQLADLGSAKNSGSAQNSAPGVCVVPSTSPAPEPSAS